MNKFLYVFVLCACVVPALAHDPNDHGSMAEEELGTVHFPTSCAASVQKPFERGVALLHSFWYEEAGKQFETVAKQDPKCAMAHWGIAISSWHQLWDHPKDATIQAGIAEVKKAKSLHPKGARERDYIVAMEKFYGPAKADYHARAAAYSEQMEKVYKRYPEDKEAAAFYALSLLASEPEGDTTFANRKKAAAVLEPVFNSEPNHPGVAHYLIHTYDKPQLAEQGLAAARKYANIAPASPHAVHMPSHIFARLGLWQDDIDSNLASVALTRKTSEMHMGGGGHQFHAMDFLVYAYLQSGREADARKVIEEVSAMPKVEDNLYAGYDPAAYAKSEFPAVYALEMHHWAEAAALQPVANAGYEDTAITYYARGLGAARGGKVAQAGTDLAQLEAAQTKATADKKTWLVDALEQNRKIIQAWIDHANRRDDAAVAALQAAAEKEEAEGDEPGALPAREMLADLLMEMSRPEQALAEYEADLKFNPNRFNGLYGAAHAAEMAGKTEQASSYYAQLLKVCSGSASDRPELQHAKQLLAKN